MNLETRLKASISRWNLLESSFYQAWNDGTLPLEALRDYSSEYGAFISLIPRGWRGHGDAETARVEEQHLELWKQFASALGRKIDEPRVDEVRELRDTAERLFADPATSLGALYAFEAQQPATSVSKLEGLRAHYPLRDPAHTYFEVHADDEEEPRLLLDRMAKLSPEQQEAAADACEETCRALRRALDGLHSRHCETATA